MAKLTRKRKDALEKFDVDSAYTLDEAAGIVKEISSTTFDSSVDPPSASAWIREKPTRCARHGFASSRKRKNVRAGPLSQ